MFSQVKMTFERGMDDIATELYTQKEGAVAAEVGPCQMLLSPRHRLPFN